MNARWLLALLVASGCAAKPELPFTLDGLRSAPGVYEVTNNTVRNPSRRLIHILDWHFVDRSDFATDTALNGEELERAYIQHLSDVEAVQSQQRKLLQYLVERHALRTVYLEGISSETLNSFESTLDLILKDRRTVASTRSLLADNAVQSVLDDTDIDPADLLSSSVALRLNYLQIGAAGQLALDGRICIMPAEDEAAYQAADPLASGEYRFDAAANERRETAICRTALAKDKVAMVILGSDHDLADNVPDDCEYIRVAVSGLPE